MNSYGIMLWVAVLAVGLLRGQEACLYSQAAGISQGRSQVWDRSYADFRERLLADVRE